MRRVLLLISHAAVFALGLGLGVYLLPILIAPHSPADAEVVALQESADYRGEFRRDLAGSDLLHWGEGRVALGRQGVSLLGRLAPGPDYRLYLVPGFVETEAAFLRLKQQSVQIGEIRTFDNFVLPLPAGVELERYTTVLVWCEAFSQFISAARYR